MRYWVFSILLAASSATSSASAGDGENYFSYHPLNPMHLGGGFVPGDLTRPKKECVTFKPEFAAGEKGALATTLSSRLIHDENELRETMGIDVRVEASYLTASASASLKLDTSRMFRRDSVTLMISAQSEYGRMVMKDLALTEYAEKLLRAGGGDIEKECGTHLVLQVRTGAKLAVFVTLSNLTETQRNALQAGAEAGGSSGAFSAKMSANFQRVFETSSASNSVNVQVASTGGEGFEGLGKVVEAMVWQPDSLAKIQSAVADYMKTFGPQNPAPIGFHTAPLGFGYIPGERLWDIKLEKRLIALAETYHRLDDQMAEIRQVLKSEDPRHILLTQADRAALEALLEELDAYQDEIANAHKQCMIAPDLKTCTGPKAHYAEYPVPPLPARPSLLANPSKPAVLDTDLEVVGDSVSSVKVILNQTPITELKVPAGVAPGQPVRVSLSRFWQARKSRIRGVVSGLVVIKDLYGRATTYVFYRALHSEQGSVDPSWEKYSREGDL
jgi:hypothetical protein